MPCVLLNYVEYCARFSVLFGGGGVFPRHSVAWPTWPTGRPDIGVCDCECSDNKIPHACELRLRTQITAHLYAH